MNHLLRSRNWEPACGAVARWHAHFRDLATAIHEISGLKLFTLSLADTSEPLSPVGRYVQQYPFLSGTIEKGMQGSL